MFLAMIPSIGLQNKLFPMPLEVRAVFKSVVLFCFVLFSQISFPVIEMVPCKLRTGLSFLIKLLGTVRQITGMYVSRMIRSLSIDTKLLGFGTLIQIHFAYLNDLLKICFLKAEIKNKTNK